MSDESSIYNSSSSKLITAIWNKKSTYCKIPKERFLEEAILYILYMTLQSQTHTVFHFRFSVTGYNLGGHLKFGKLQL